MKDKEVEVAEALDLIKENMHIMPDGESKH
jgi:hypothetical protein